MRGKEKERKSKELGKKMRGKEKERKSKEL